MQTQRVDISPDDWTEIGQGSDLILVEGASSDAFFLHFSNLSAKPEISAPFHQFETWPNAIDFSRFGMVPGQRVWVRSKARPSSLTVTRNVDVYTLFVPIGSDSLQTVNGNTFKVIEE